MHSLFLAQSLVFLDTLKCASALFRLVCLLHKCNCFIRFIVFSTHQECFDLILNESRFFCYPFSSSFLSCFVSNPPNQTQPNTSYSSFCKICCFVILFCPVRNHHTHTLPSSSRLTSTQTHPQTTSSHRFVSFPSSKRTVFVWLQTHFRTRSSGTGSTFCLDSLRCQCREEIYCHTHFFLPCKPTNQPT